MPDQSWESLKEIFHAAVALPQNERQSYVARACGDDESLRAAVESLLKSHDGTAKSVKPPAFEAAAEMLVENQQPKPGETIGHYRILSVLGQGGMGMVYLAEDTKLGRKVSLKFLPAEFNSDPARLRRFEQEARAISALNHPNTLTIHEIGETNGHRFIATEFIDGKTLRERLRAQLDIDEALEIAIGVVSALVAAHRLNIVHRDVKPDNIMIRDDDGLVKLLDFGLAKRSVQATTVDHDADTHIRNTSPGVVVGTVTYMSPEQARGETVDERTDIWSLGVVLYEMIVGASPFLAGTSNEIISAILSKQPAPSLSRNSPSVPDRLEEIVEKTLAKNRDERYQTSKDLLIDLKRLRQSLQSHAALDRGATVGQAAESVKRSGVKTNEIHSVSSAEYLVNKVKDHKRWIVLSSLALLVVVSGLIIYGWRQRQTIASNRPALSSIAVLPFSSTSSDPDAEFLSEGITDNVIERLSQLPGLKVTSHTAVSRYKGGNTDPRTIASELGVEAVLTGQVVRRGDDLTIRLELVNAKDDSHIWGANYDRKFSDLLSVQREIPLDVSDKLRLRLSGESKERLSKPQTQDLEAYRLYLKGRYYWEQWTREGAKQAADYFEQAIKKDPNYALAYAGLADAYVFGSYAGRWVSQNEAHLRAGEAATKALSLDPQLGEAHAALGSVLLYADWNLAGAEREFKQGLELSPNFAEGHHEYSHLLLLLERHDESLVESKKFLELDPVSESPIGHLAYHYWSSRQDDLAIQQYKKLFELYPNTRETNWSFQLGDIYADKQMYREAIEQWLKGYEGDGFEPEKIKDLNEAFAKSGITGFYRKLIQELESEPEDQLDLITIAEIHARLGEKDKCFEWLEKAYAKRTDFLVHLRESHGFDSVRSDPRYADLCRRIGLPV